VKRSNERMLTTHVGSLPRPQPFLDATPRPGEPAIVDQATWQRTLRASIAEVVRTQADIGIDVISDGEFGKSNWQAYIMERLSGFEGRAVQPHKWSYIGRDLETFADFYKESRPELFKLRTRWVCTGPIEYDATQIRRDIANFKGALRDVHVEEAFMPVIAPGSIALDDQNLYYPNDAAYVQAVAEALKHEYHAIVDAGLLLQVDDAILANLHDLLSVDGETNYLRWAESRIEALNYALEGIPSEKVRYHLCWGSWHGPHTSDVPLRTIVNTILKARAQAFSIEAANPRHEHEFTVWEEVRLPDDKLLLPGVITHRTPVVEHPEVVKMRVLRYARIVGRENVIASSDCGFAQGTRTLRVHPSIVWAKLESLVEGARRATRELWS
jgi:5-methyltetrahydropteroyltriglutamate--homocysteine methyltransferase